MQSVRHVEGRKGLRWYDIVAGIIAAELSVLMLGTAWPVLIVLMAMLALIAIQTSAALYGARRQKIPR